MIKEFNNERSDSYTISFMGKEILLHKWNRERNYNQSLSVENSLRKQTFFHSKIQTCLPNAHSPCLDLAIVLMLYHNIPLFTHGG